MPLREYLCEACEHQFETIQGVNDAPLTTCPECGKERLKKLIAAPAFNLKGGGWYKDLYSSSSSSGGSSSGTGGSSSGSGGTASSGADTASSSGTSSSSGTASSASSSGSSSGSGNSGKGSTGSSSSKS